MHPAAPGGQVAEDAADAVRGDGDGDVDHGLQQHRAAAPQRLAQGEPSGGAERQVGGVLDVGRPVGEGDPDSGDRVAERAVREGVPAARRDGLHELLRNPPAGDGGAELEAVGAGFAERFDVDHDVRELPGAAVLFDVPQDEPGDRRGERLPVGDPRAADGDLQPGAVQRLHRHLQVQFAQPGQHPLPALRIGADHQGRVLLGEPEQRRRQPVGVHRAAGLDRDGHHRVGGDGRFQHQRGAGCAQRAAGAGGLGPDDGDDVAGHRRVGLGVPVGLHPQDAADPLGAAGACVEHGVPLSQGAGVDPQATEPSGGVRVDLEHQGGQRLLGVGGAFLDGALPVAAHRRDVQRRGQVRRHRVEQRFDPAVAVRRAAEHHHRLSVGGELTQRGGQGIRAEGAGGAVLLQCRRVQFGHGLRQRLSSTFRLRRQLHWHLSDLDAVGAVRPGERAQPEQVDHAGEVALPADRHLHGQRHRVEPVADRGDRAVQVRAGPVHLVDERDPRHAVPVGLAPHRFALRLDARDGVEHRHRAVQHAQRPFHLVGEVHVARRVDQVQPVPRPVATDRSSKDGDAAVALLRIEVGDGGAVVHLAAPVGLTGQEQDALGDGGLPGIHVGEDAEVADRGGRGNGNGAGEGGGEVGAHGPVPFGIGSWNGQRDSRHHEQQWQHWHRTRPRQARTTRRDATRGGRSRQSRTTPSTGFYSRGLGRELEGPTGTGRAAGAGPPRTPGSPRTATGERQQRCYARPAPPSPRHGAPRPSGPGVSQRGESRDTRPSPSPD
ncbi:hypothetical protein KCH_57970 [Kitasatospora cheerisanensis KCTC 2395]|uniref:Uncharacterized protein n=1 Tax=Kitasatospora cheerisanensis KCTC 2395 TaxID=1348663 RepID=A0A066YR38_9ACTN|nr:hypothetical protein KCH_57970 [Kitasatospora cheerisanensis KCTC 2395]